MLLSDLQLACIFEVLQNSNLNLIIVSKTYCNQLDIVVKVLVKAIHDY